MKTQQRTSRSGRTRHRNQQGSVLIWVAGVIVLLLAGVVWLIVGVRGGARGLQEAFGAQRYESVQDMVQILDTNGFPGCSARVSDDKPPPESGFPSDSKVVICRGSGYLVAAGWFPDTVPTPLEELMCTGPNPIGGSLVVGDNWIAYAISEDLMDGSAVADELSAADAERTQAALGGEVQTVSCG